MKSIIKACLLLSLLVALLPAPALAQDEVVCERDVIVEAGDWLSKIAADAYGDPLAYRAIIEATNQKALADSSYASIEDPALIEPGWKLCLPGAAASSAEMVDEMEPAPTAASPTTAGQETAPGEAGVVQLTLLQLNDIYELTPVSGGAEGGLARVATLHNELLAANPNTLIFLAGDLFSPSALGTARVDGERLAGRQMVDTFNQIGLDYITFGNHEFDVSEDQFLARLSESQFAWVSSNVFDANGDPLPGVLENDILTVTGGGDSVRVGIFGLTIDSNPASYVTYTDPFEAAGAQVAALSDQVDILIALTHLALEDDIELALRWPEIDIILGGHEHENIQLWRGPDQTPIFKADANARSAYVHHLTLDKAGGDLEIASQLRLITDAIPGDPQTQAVIDRWLAAGFAGFRESGFDPEAVVASVPIALDGKEGSVRNRPTDLTQAIAQGMLNEVPGAELAIFNGGSVRIDDVVPPGNLTEYDVIRILPFGGVVLSAEMKGSLLQQVLDQGQANQGNGGYLQTANVSRDEAGTAWQINDEPLDPERVYLVAINDFLLTGNEQGLAFLNRDNADVTVAGEHADIRFALINQLKREYSEN